MKYNIVLVPFPFDDLSATKVRPALCLTDKIAPYNHVVLAFITSRASKTRTSDLVLDSTAADFSVTGLQVSSTIWVHRLATVSESIIIRQLGELSSDQAHEVEERLRG